MTMETVQLMKKQYAEEDFDEEAIRARIGKVLDDLKRGRVYEYNLKTKKTQRLNP